MERCTLHSIHQAGTHCVLKSITLVSHNSKPAFQIYKCLLRVRPASHSPIRYVQRFQVLAMTQINTYH